jgi:hypothetical protein
MSKKSQLRAHEDGHKRCVKFSWKILAFPRCDIYHQYKRTREISFKETVISGVSLKGKNFISSQRFQTKDTTKSMRHKIE